MNKIRIKRANTERAVIREWTVYSSWTTARNAALDYLDELIQQARWDAEKQAKQ